MGRSLSEITRRENRIFVSLPVSVRMAPQGLAEVCGNTVDYSTRGLRVRANVPFQPGQGLEVIVRDNGNELKGYNVVWVREPAQGQSVYEAGLELKREDPI